MRVSGRESPIRKLAQFRRGVMSFTWTTLEGESSCVSGPVAAPKDNVVIAKIVRCLLAFDTDGLEVVVIPKERPEILGADLTETFQPFGDALSFAVLKPLSESIKQVVVCVKTAVGMCAFVLVAFSRAC